MPELQPVFDELHRRPAVHEDAFLASDSSRVLGASTAKYPDAPWLAGIRLGGRTLRDDLMSGYAEPAAVDPMSHGLRRRVEGKSCFNVSRVNQSLLEELTDLTARGCDLYSAAGLSRG